MHYYVVAYSFVMAYSLENFRELNVAFEAENLEYLLDLVDWTVLDGLEFVAVAVDFVVVVDDDDGGTNSFVAVVVVVGDDEGSSDSAFAAIIASVVLGSNVEDLSSAYFDADVASVDSVGNFQAFVPENLVASYLVAH